jgi:glycosyltransferase involved in cell wall biosynthesis
MDVIESISSPVLRSRSRPLRVAHLYSSLGIYGAERWASTLIKYLDVAAVDTMVITVGTKPGATLFRDFLAKQGVRTEHIAIPGKLSLRAVRALRAMLQRECIDILHTHGFKSDALGYLATRGRKEVKLISTQHGWAAGEGVRIRMYESIGRIFLRAFDRIYPLSPALRDDLIARGFAREQVKLIVNGVDIASFDACYRQRTARRPHDACRVLFAGRLCRTKGVMELIQGFAGLGLEPARLRIAGSGPQRNELEALAKRLGLADRLEFLGPVSCIIPQLRWADVLVLPSYVEGIPRIVMEAFAAGVPVIASDIPGTRELVEHMRTGLLVTPGEPQQISAALATIAKKPDLGRSLACAARDRIEQEFSARRVAEDYTAEYRALVAR